MRRLFQRLQAARRAVVRHAVAAERVGFAAHEQSLTEITLTRAAPAASAWTFTQRAEGDLGADWLWWWKGGGEWFGALVQAKRNKPKGGVPWYDFGYRRGGGPRQVDQLIATAGRLRIPAVYALYNHPPLGRRVAVGKPCCTLPNESWRVRLNVAVLPALIAAHIVGWEDAATRYSRPLECLTCPGAAPLLIPTVRSGISDRELQDFVDNVARNLPRTVARGLLAQIAQMRISQLRAGSAQLSLAGEVQPDQVFAALPDDRGHLPEPYFEHVLRGLRRRPPDYVSAALDGVPLEELRNFDLDGIAGLVIFDEGGT